MTLISHAVKYGQMGFEIFPVNHKNKRPLVSQKSATTDKDQIIRWWKQFPDALIGHRIAPDMIILDVDPRHNGLDTWHRLVREFHIPSTTRIHYSGRGDGGMHLWFQRPDGDLAIGGFDSYAAEHELGCEVKGRWISGIDLLTHDHRYTILPPSIHPATGKPYYWADEETGVSDDVAELPRELAELLTEKQPQYKKVDTHEEETQWRDPDSIADWYSANHRFSDLLPEHGWSCVEGDGDEDGSGWRHPEATNDLSATVRHGCLFVHSTSTGFEPTTPGRPHGYTIFAAYSVLVHDGDQTRAARAARKLKQELEGGDPGKAQSPEILEDDFWTRREFLTHIRDFARARRVAPLGLLGVVLARIASACPPHAVLPPLVGSHMSLNMFVMLVGKSGAGKDATVNAARDAIDLQHGIYFKSIGLGSGEGLLDQYVKYVPPKDDDPGGVEQHNKSVLFVNTEIETIHALKGRSSSTLMSELRNAWTGSRLGFAYANKERRLYVDTHCYRLCLVLGAQPEHAGVVAHDGAAGTPQRFLWLPVADPDAPELPPDEPPAWDWRLPEWGISINGRATMEVCDCCTEAIDQARLERLRNTSDDGDSGHALALREKLAALLAIAEVRANINDEDWELAGELLEISNRTRLYVHRTIESVETHQVKKQGKQNAQRAEAESDAVQERVIQKVLDKAKRTDGYMLWGDITRCVNRHERAYLESAVAVLEGRELIETQNGRHDGKPSIKAV